MSPLLKLSVRIEKWFTQISRMLPEKVWYGILGVTILGAVFFRGILGPEIINAFAIFWLFALMVVVVGGQEPTQKDEASYLGLVLGGILLVAFIWYLISSVVPVIVQMLK